MKLLLIRILGAFILSYGLIGMCISIGGYFVLVSNQVGFIGVPTPLPTFGLEIFLMTLGLVLVSYDFSRIIKLDAPSRGRK